MSARMEERRRKQAEVRANRSALREARTEPRSRKEQILTRAQRLEKRRREQQRLRARQTALRQRRQKRVARARREREHAARSPVGTDAGGQGPGTPQSRRPITLPRHAVLRAAGVTIAAGAGLFAGSLTTDSGGAAPPPAERAPRISNYQRDLAHELKTLAATRAAGLSRLRSAQSAEEQTSATRALAAVHSQTARALRRGSAPPDTRRALAPLLAALTHIARSYDRLAEGAAKLRPSVYLRAQAEVRQTEAQLRRVLRTLEGKSG